MTRADQRVIGKTIKLLLMLPNSDHKEVTFDVPDDCTIQDVVDELMVS